MAEDQNKSDISLPWWSAFLDSRQWLNPGMLIAFLGFSVTLGSVLSLKGALNALESQFPDFHKSTYFETDAESTCHPKVGADQLKILLFTDDPRQKAALSALQGAISMQGVSAALLTLRPYSDAKSFVGAIASRDFSSEIASTAIYVGRNNAEIAACIRDALWQGPFSFKGEYKILKTKKADEEAYFPSGDLLKNTILIVSGVR